MKSYTWEGTATAVTSIVHGGETLGTINYLRREAFLTPQGRIEIPVISGNALRGILRDTAATLLWEKLGKPKLPMPIAHALWAGGALVKSRHEPLTGQRLVELRNLIPLIGVFGTAGGGRIIDSALTVSKLIPICIQTAPLLPTRITQQTFLPDIYDLLQIEEYSRTPDTEKNLHKITENIENLANLNEGLMRYGVETFISGTPFYMSLSLQNVTDNEHDFFTETFNIWNQNPTIGGRTGRGHGKLKINLTPHPTVNPEQTWQQFENTSTPEIIQKMTWLD